MENYSDDEIKKLAYMSTRQFVLVSRDVKGPNPDYPVPVTSGERWWTLCVPCDVTKGEVDKVFGEGTHLCLFSKVDRTIDKENGNTLHLYFQNDTYTHKYTRNTNGTWTKGEAVEDDNVVVLYAHTPYMIYPTKRDNDGKEYILSNYELQPGDVRVSVVDANGGQSTGDIKYEYTGTYRSAITTTTTDVEGKTTTTSSPVLIPQYSYAFGKKGNGNSQFWFIASTKSKWAANKCLVQRYDANGKDDYDTLFGGNSESSDAKQISTFGDDDETTAIDRVVYHYGDDDSDAAVYTLGGQRVNGNSLTKGIYVKAGKKFVVK